MNYLLIEVSGEDIIVRSGSLEGHKFRKEEMIYISGDSILFSPTAGAWWLQRTKWKGKQAIVCGFFDKRTGLVIQRYIKNVSKDGWYMCGPRYPRVISEEEAERKLAA